MAPALLVWPPGIVPPAWGAPRAGLGRIDARSRPLVPRRRSPSSGLRPAPRPSGGAIGFATSVGSRGAAIRNHCGDKSAWLSGKQNRITAAEEVLERSVTSRRQTSHSFFLSGLLSRGKSVGRRAYSSAARRRARRRWRAPSSPAPASPPVRGRAGARARAGLGPSTA